MASRRPWQESAFALVVVLVATVGAHAGITAAFDSDSLRPLTNYPTWERHRFSYTSDTDIGSGGRTLRLTIFRRYQSGTATIPIGFAITFATYQILDVNGSQIATAAPATSGVIHLPENWRHPPEVWRVALIGARAGLPPGAQRILLDAALFGTYSVAWDRMELMWASAGLQGVMPDTGDFDDMANGYLFRADSDHDGIQDPDDPDMDGDGLANGADPDRDGDDVPDDREEMEGTSANNWHDFTDRDGDGRWDNGDDDGDGYTNRQERDAGSDPDGAGSRPDSDGDGVEDNEDADGIDGPIDLLQSRLTLESFRPSADVVPSATFEIPAVGSGGTSNVTLSFGGDVETTGAIRLLVRSLLTVAIGLWFIIKIFTTLRQY